MNVSVVVLLMVLTIGPTFSLFWGLFGGGITYYLYTRQNPVYGQQLVYGNFYSLSNSFFNNERPTRLVIHGSSQNGQSIFSRDLKNSYLRRGYYNVIIVDWSSITGAYYVYSRYKVGIIGMAVSKFVTWLNTNYNTLHLIGFDLGAHVAGIAGKYTIRGRISRIIGLDPSLPLFNEFASSGRISAGDSQLVEIFHSNGGQLGMFSRIGDIDYYINNGRIQPECTVVTNASCSHYRSVITFTRLLINQNNYVIVPCNDLTEVAAGCSLDPIEILLEEISPSGIYQINTVNAEALNTDVEIIDNIEGSAE